MWRFIYFHVENYPGMSLIEFTHEPFKVIIMGEKLISPSLLPYFLDQTPRLLIFSSRWDQRRLFQGSVYLRAASINFNLATHTN